MRFIKAAILSVEYFRIAWWRLAPDNTAAAPVDAGLAWPMG
jgi:hypothetical protein